MKPEEMDDEEFERLNETLRKLDASYDAMMREQDILADFEESLEKETKNLITKHYSEEIANLSAEGYRELDNAIYFYASGIASRISFIIDQHIEE